MRGNFIVWFYPVNENPLTFVPRSTAFSIKIPNGTKDAAEYVGIMPIESFLFCLCNHLIELWFPGFLFVFHLSVFPSILTRSIEIYLVYI